MLERSKQGIVGAECNSAEGENDVSSSEKLQPELTSLSGIVDRALQQTKECGTCSLGLLWLDNAGETIQIV